MKTDPEMQRLSRAIVAQARALGADLAGVANVADLKASPSHRISEALPEFKGEGTKPTAGRKRGVVTWPEGVRSAVVIAIEHPAGRPELDWWITPKTVGDTPGNKLLRSAIDDLADWLEREHGVCCSRLPYHVDHGAIFMKDTAVLAGLGCIGMNNMLVTPQFGPRQRLRVMLTDADLPTTGAADYDPCDGCPRPCREACPQKAFAETIYTGEEYGLEELPGRTGVFARLRCNKQMTVDNAAFETIAIDGQVEPAKRVKYCRECELACLVVAR